MRVTAVAGALLCLGTAVLSPVVQSIPVPIARSDIHRQGPSLFQAAKEIIVSLQLFDIHFPEIFATPHLIQPRRLPADEQGFGSAPVSNWGSEPKTGMGSKPKTGLGRKPKQKTGKKSKQGIGKKPKQGTGEKPRGFCKDCPIPDRTAKPNNEIPNSTTTTSGLPADRTMSSNEREKSVVKPSTGGDERVLAADGRSWVKRAPFGQSGDDDDDRVMASDGRSWVKRDVASGVTNVDRSTMHSDSQTWGKRGPSLEVQERGEVPGSDESESGPTPASLSNDFDWSRRSPDGVNLAEKMERANANAGRPVDPDGFITVDKRSIPSAESTLSDVTKRNHSDILWEFMPEGQSRVGSTIKS